MRREKWRTAVFYYISYAQTRLEGKNFTLLHPSKHWRLAAVSFYPGESYWRAAQPAKFSQQPYGDLVIRDISRIK